jgi:hypothetical protein
MTAILIEGVLFVALIAAGGALVAFLLMEFTPVGVWLRQTLNRRRIDSAAALVCPIHGPRHPHDLVRLASGEKMCPDCYKETLS